MLNGVRMIKAQYLKKKKTNGTLTYGFWLSELKISRGNQGARCFRCRLLCFL